MVATSTDTLCEDIDAARALLTDLLRRWAATKSGPMSRVNLHEAISWEVAQALANGESEVQANMCGRGLSRAAPMLAHDPTARF